MLKLKSRSLDWALNHVLKFGDTNVLPIPFEYKAIKQDWQNICQYLAEENILNWKTRLHRMLLSPKEKAKYGFRVITQLDPLDLLVYAACLKEVAQEIENHRIPVADKVVFSFRYAPEADGQLFDPSIGKHDFRDTCRNILDDNRAITHVAVADIADFYSRIYHHRLEGALQAATRRDNHRKAIMNLLRSWNVTETYGIPVGSAPSSLLAEITISDVDEALLANRVRFVRFNDDYRIFANSHTEAYRHLAFLAHFLFNNHGLTLQSSKTFVLDVETFRNRFLPAPVDREQSSLRERFQDLVDRLQLDYAYAVSDYDDLEPEDQQLVDSLNLVDLFKEELHSSDEPDLSMIRFILNRLGGLEDTSILEDALDNLDFIYPVFPNIIRYIRNCRKVLSIEEKLDVGARVIKLLQNSIISELEYYKTWGLGLFTRSSEWGNSDSFLKILNSTPDPMTRRQLILAIGRASQRFWSQAQWRGLFDEGPWPRRALLAAASCLPADARNHWYKSVKEKLDPLERAVVRWAKKYPFGRDEDEEEKK